MVYLLKQANKLDLPSKRAVLPSTSIIIKSINGIMKKMPPKVRIYHKIERYENVLDKNILK